MKNYARVITIVTMSLALPCLSSITFAQALNPPQKLRLGTEGPNTNTSITHGSQLAAAMTGPSALGVNTGQLTTVTAPGSVGYWRVDADTRPGFVPSGNYVYNNAPTNHGGTVPAGGMVIDGFVVPAGTYVTQFYNFNEGLYVTGAAGPGIVFRGCRFRGNNSAPGYINVAYNPPANVTLWYFYNDAGGLGAANAQYNEVIFGSSAVRSYFYRNYLSYTSTALQPGDKGPVIIENYIEKVTCYYCPNPPPGESTIKHLNGISLNGGQTSALILRNYVVLQSPDDAGRIIDQTDALAFFQDFGDFPGTGQNPDDTIGYQVKDNFLGGGGYSVYAGMNSGKPATSVKNMVMTGNIISTQWWPQGGYFGAIAAEPVWGSYGNVKTNNTFAGTSTLW